MKNPVIIFGANPIGKVALDIFNANDITVYGFLDDRTELHKTEINNVSVLGRTDDDGFLKLIGKKCEAFVAYDDNRIKKKFVEMITERREQIPMSAIHQQAVISPTASLGQGVFVNAGAIVNSNAAVGNYCMIHSRALIDYDCIINDFVQIGAGAIVNSGVEIAEGAFIGSGAIIVSGVKIGKNARIGAGSVVLQDVKDKQTVLGNPAREIQN